MAKIEDNTDEVLKEVDRRIGQNLITAALLVERTAKQIAPVRTATLKRSITHAPQIPKREVVVGTNVVYAPYVELGTKHMSARPYLRPALEANMGKIRKLFSAL